MTRDELAREIFMADNANAAHPDLEWAMAPDSKRAYAYDLADAMWPRLRDAWNAGMLAQKLVVAGVKGKARNPYDEESKNGD